MNKDEELENYLSISPRKFGIYLFDKKNFKNLYKEELIVNDSSKFLDFNNLKIFLDNNVFKIEKLSGKFIENIFFIFEDNKIFNLEMGIKKKIITFLLQKNILKIHLLRLETYLEKTILTKKLCI